MVGAWLRQSGMHVCLLVTLQHYGFAVVSQKLVTRVRLATLSAMLHQEIGCIFRYRLLVFGRSLANDRGASWHLQACDISSAIPQFDATFVSCRTRRWRRIERNARAELWHTAYLWLYAYFILPATSFDRRVTNQLQHLMKRHHYE